MASVWPSTLPQDMLNQGFSMTPRDNAIRFSPEIGPPMDRRRGNSAPIDIQGSILCTTDQWSTLLTFYRDTLKETDLFTWKDPITGLAATFKFNGPPSINEVTQGSNPMVSVSLPLMILP
jgi:hypothetical protein